MNGIINLLKPPCLSSAQAVSFIKRLTKQKVGHAGTLDPEACGVLPVMIGKATSLFDYIAGHRKVYVTEIAFGTSTDTQDATGTITARGNQCPDAERLSRILESFVGTIYQIPPSFSALKRDGKPLYALARAGKMVEVPARPIDVYSIELLTQTSLNTFLLRIDCGKGTYIRTICHDIGQRLDCPSHMRFLLRERTGPFRIEDAITLEEFEHLTTKDIRGGSWLLSMEDTVAHLPQLSVKDKLWKPCINGVAIDPKEAAGAEHLLDGDIAALYCRDTLIGLYVKKSGMLRVKTMLVDRSRMFS